MDVKMQISNNCIKAISHHEGVRQKPYRDSVYLWTVGVGHLMYDSQARLPVDQRAAIELLPQDNRTFSMEEVNAILRTDLARFERGVTTFCPVPLTQGNFDGLVSFAFNVGLGTLQRSTLRQKVLRGDIQGAADEFLKYNKAGGKVLKGLVTRRNDERALFLS
jgi:lysozyme